MTNNTIATLVLTPMTTLYLNPCACLDLLVDVGETLSGNGELVTDSDDVCETVCVDVDKIVVVTSEQDVFDGS